MQEIPGLYLDKEATHPMTLATTLFFNNYIWPYLIIHSEKMMSIDGEKGQAVWLDRIINIDFMQKNIMRAVNDATKYLKLHAAEMMRQYRPISNFEYQDKASKQRFYDTTRCDGTPSIRTRRRNSDSMIRHEVMAPRSSIEYHRMLLRDHPATLPGTNSHTPGLFQSNSIKAFALTGRQACVRHYPGRCPGLRASALSGRVGATRSNTSALYLSLRPVTIGSGRVGANNKTNNTTTT